MAKTNQRKQSAYWLGKNDASNKKPFFRWKKHRYLEEYTRGFNSVKKAKPRKFSLLQWIKKVFS